jgi:hypothetical protein
MSADERLRAVAATAAAAAAPAAYLVVAAAAARARLRRRRYQDRHAATKQTPPAMVPAMILPALGPVVGTPAQREMPLRRKNMLKLS